MDDSVSEPVVTLDHAVALAMVEGPQAGLELLPALDEDPRMTARHRLHAVRSHPLEHSPARRRARVRPTSLRSG